jgi:hypothetical protein
MGQPPEIGEAFDIVLTQIRLKVQDVEGSL